MAPNSFRGVGSWRDRHRWDGGETRPTQPCSDSCQFLSRASLLHEFAEGVRQSLHIRALFLPLAPFEFCKPDPHKPAFAFSSPWTGLEDSPFAVILLNLAADPQGGGARSRGYAARGDSGVPRTELRFMPSWPGSAPPGE